VPVRVRPALLVLAVGVTVGLVAILLGARVAPPARMRAAAPAPSAAVATTLQDRALAVLDAWDVRRAAAWAAGDARRLAALYPAGSSAGAADAALLRRYADRGLVVRGMQMQVLRVRVLAMRPRLVEVEVTDRLTGAVAARVADPTTVRALPADPATTRVLVLRRVDGRWLMARVSAVGRR
jgi:hypothetical protein